jgi:hypothetical protein
MSDNDSKINALKNIGAKVNDLRQSNPKVFYGGLAVVVILVLFLLISGGGTSQAPQVKATLKVGETYRLVNPNGGEVLLVAVPGQFSSVEYNEEDSQNICVVDSGTRAILQEETFVNYINYVKVQPSDGPCKGKSGWTSKVNIKK